jgi:CRP-like cAMP-binding protein
MSVRVITQDRFNLYAIVRFSFANVQTNVYYYSPALQERSMRPNPPSPSALNARDNQLLAQLPEALLRRLEDDFEPVRLQPGALLATAGQPVRSVYFPVTSVLSLLCTDVDGSSIQVGMVGREGMLGIASLFGGVHAASCLVLAGGHALKLAAPVLQELFRSERILHDTLLVYVSRALEQASQIALCNRFHAPERQLCNLLLLVLDRSGDVELTMTHDLIARLLGVRRETVTQAAMRVQARGYVRYSRGHIHVLDRGGVERLACGCHRRFLAPGLGVAG